MRIISPFHDYYDSVQAQGQDQSLLYLRQPRETLLPESMFPLFKMLRRWGRDIIDERCLVGFCGRVVPVLNVWHPQRYEVPQVLCYTVAEVDAFVEANCKKRVIEHYYAAKRRSDRQELWRYTPHVVFEKFFEACAAQQNQFEHLFRENRCPVFTYRECRAGNILTYNGRLKNLQFYRVVDAYTAFQEIQMYLGGMASPEKPIPPVDDKTLAAAKGFDKWSFRKEPR